MLRRITFSILLVALGAGAAALVFGAFINPHQATGEVNTAVSNSEALYICQPLGTTDLPQCPLDTNGADELIFAASEDLLPGSVEWQKVRVRNVGLDPWDLLSMTGTWTETADPGSDCAAIPEAVMYMYGSGSVGSTELTGPTGPGVTVLGIPNGVGVYPVPEPVDNVSYSRYATTYYNPVNDNHGSINSSVMYQSMGGGIQSVHVAPGAYEDLLLGIRLPIGTPDACLDVVWTVTTTWNVQIHNP